MWTKKQKQIAVMACSQAGVDDAARKLILRQFTRAMYNRAGMPVSTPSSTSPKLTNADFEDFLAIIEDRAGGKILHFTPGYFANKSARRSAVAGERMAGRIRELASPLNGTYDLSGLAWRFSAQRTRDIEELRPREAWNLIEMLKAVIQRDQANEGPRDVGWDESANPTTSHNPTTNTPHRQQRLFSNREAKGLAISD